MKCYLAPIIILLSLTYSSEILGQIEIDTVGYTQYVTQSMGRTGNRIVLDNQGTVHLAWTKSHPYPNIRDVYYNCISSLGSPFPGVGQRVSYGNGAGYPEIAAFNDGRAAIIYHNIPINAESIFVAIDAFSCLGQFEYHRVPNRYPDFVNIWPSLTIDSSNRLHASSTQITSAGSLQRMIYSRSTDGGNSWGSAAVVDTITNSSVITSSRVSAKVAMVYASPVDSSSNKNNIFYIQSMDGLIWDYRIQRINITSYPADDSMFAYSDFDAIYDNHENLHIVWLAQAHSGDTVTGPIYLYHFDRNSGTIREITHFEMPEICDFPIGYHALAMVSLACDDLYRLFTAYARFDTSDCSMTGMANGELFTQYSTDDGLNWNPPINISNTPSPNCQASNCISELWPSLAETADYIQRLTCIVDNGGPSEQGGDFPVEYYQFQIGILGANESNSNLPDDLKFSAYPNPFNTRTTIQFSIEKAGPVELEVYDLLGRKIAQLLDEQLPVGKHDVVWNADGIPSGLYYCRLLSNGAVSTSKLALIK